MFCYTYLHQGMACGMFLNEHGLVMKNKSIKMDEMSAWCVVVFIIWLKMKLVK